MNTHFKYLLLLSGLTLMLSCKAQTPMLDKTTMQDTTAALPYESIPDYPESYTATNVTSRLIDGLGFRYRWATESLTVDDLNYKPDSTARTSLETMEHILGLSNSIVNAVLQKPNVRPSTKEELTWEEMRLKTLTNFQQASQILLKSTDEDLKKYEIVFSRGDKSSAYPFWHQYNGFIADALWHVGQVVSFRRASGNPIDNRVSVFSGRVRER